MNSADIGATEQVEEEKVDKTLRRLKPIPRREPNIAPREDSLPSDSEDED